MSQSLVISQIDNEHKSHCQECGSKLIVDQNTYICEGCGLVYTDIVFDTFTSIDKAELEKEQIIQRNLNQKKGRGEVSQRIEYLMWKEDRYKQYNVEKKNYMKIITRVNEAANRFSIQSTKTENIKAYINKISKELLEKYDVSKLDIITALIYSFIKNEVTIDQYRDFLLEIKARFTITKLNKLYPIVVREILHNKITVNVENVYCEKLITLISNKLIKYEELGLIKSNYERKKQTKISIEKFRETIIINCKTQMEKIGYDNIINRNKNVVSSFLLSSVKNNCINESKAAVIMGNSRVALSQFKKIMEKKQYN